jgi:hypothetical protein
MAGPEGLHKQTQCDAGTMCRNQCLPPRPHGGDSALPESPDWARLRAALRKDTEAALVDAAMAALREVQSQMERQETSLDVHHIGLYEGSEYVQNRSHKQKVKDEAKAKKAGIATQQTNCITLMKDALIAYQDDLLLPWGQITKRTEDADDRGTTLLREFRKRAGATTVYVIAPGKTYQAHAESSKKYGLVPTQKKGAIVKGIHHPKENYDVRLPVDLFISQKDAAAQLGNVPFGLGIAVYDSDDTYSPGVHTFVYSYSSVYEVHYLEGPRSRKVFEKSTLEHFMHKWHSVVIAVPPGPWMCTPAGGS